MFYALFYKYADTHAVGRHKDSDCWQELVAIARSEWDVWEGWYILDKKGNVVCSSQDEGEGHVVRNSP